MPTVSLKAKALQLLAQRDHGRLELRRKLLRHLRREQEREHAPAGDAGAAQAASVGSVDELLDWLTEHRYLDESRFVEARVHARAARFGMRRIEAELGQRGASLDAATAERLRNSEFERARAVWARRYGVAPQDAGERARQARFLAGRGFSTETIRRVLRAD